MATPFDLSPDRLDDIFDNILKDPQIGFDKVASVSNPKGIMLAGQPGAGKSAVMKKALAELGKEGAVVLDSDELRRFYPDIDDLKKKYPTDWANHTQDAASKWNKMLREAALKKNKNVVLDGTLSKTKSALNNHERGKPYNVGRHKL